VENKISPAVKIEVKPDDSDSLLKYTFNNNAIRRINIKDIIEGKRVNSSSISPSGRFVLLGLTETFPEGKSVGFTEIYDVKEKRTIISETAFRSQLRWMPKSDLLFYVDDNNGDRSVMTLDPQTLRTKVLAKGLPKENFYIAPDEKSIFFSSKETIIANNPAGLKRMFGIDDRQLNYRDRYFLYRYYFDTGLTQQLTFGKQSA